MPVQPIARQPGLLDDYLTEGQLALELGVSVRTVKRWRGGKHFGLPFVMVGRKVYVKREVVKQWLEKQAS